MADRIPGAAWPGKKAPGGLEVLEVLVGTTHNSTTKVLVEQKHFFSDFPELSTGSILWMQTKMAADLQEEAEHSGTGLDRESLLQKSGRVCAS